MDKFLSVSVVMRVIFFEDEQLKLKEGFEKMKAWYGQFSPIY
jgi:hypothetical protein